MLCNLRDYVKTFMYVHAYTGSSRKNATLLHHYNLGLKLINCLISLRYVAEVRQILRIQLDLNYCKQVIV